MEFADKLKEFCDRVRNLRAKIKTEEATKTSLIMPFFSLLGYDVFNPLEFVPEYTADVGIKKGEKVDYAIVDKKQNPLILIEAKFCGEKLNKHGGQLFRYFSTTPAKFGILTNGILYQFYTDLDESNKMDKTPFLVVNLLSLDDGVIPYLQKFEKATFSVDNVIEKANELRYNDRIKQILSQQIIDPEDSFVAYVINDIYSGRKTQRIIDNFRPLVKNAFAQIISDKVNEQSSQSENLEPPIEKETPVAVVDSTPNLDSMEKFFVVKFLVHEHLNGQSLSYCEDKKVFEILIEEEPPRWLCRFDCEEKYLYINLPSNDKPFIRRKIRTIDDVYCYKSLLCQVLCRNKDAEVSV